MQIKKLSQQEIPEALRLVWGVFTEFEAPEYSSEGIKNFKSFIDNRDLINKLAIYAAFDAEKIIGVAATRREGNHISLFFVDRQYHRRGIGRRLFETVLMNSTSDLITVHSSPFAAEAYRRLGFSDTDKEQVENGIIYIPMEYKK
ncbi:MAG: GNAT family N-acetyltransferase [Oscillospiraceae bacterium]